MRKVFLTGNNQFSTSLSWISATGLRTAVNAGVRHLYPVDYEVVNASLRLADPKSFSVAVLNAVVHVHNVTNVLGELRAIFPHDAVVQHGLTSKCNQLAF